MEQNVLPWIRKCWEDIAIAERRLLRKILGPIKERDEYRRRHNNELYKHVDKITDTISHICKEWTVTDSQEEFLNILENWKYQWNGKWYWGTSNYTGRHHRAYSA